MGHKLADLRDQGLIGSPNYNLTNDNATVGFRPASTPYLSDTSIIDSSDDHQSPPSGHVAGPQRVRARNGESRAYASHEPYSTSHHVRSNRRNGSAAWNDTSIVKHNHPTSKSTECKLTATQRSNRYIGSNKLCPNFTATGIPIDNNISPLLFVV